MFSMGLGIRSFIVKLHEKLTVNGHPLVSMLVTSVVIFPGECGAQDTALCSSYSTMDEAAHLLRLSPSRVCPWLAGDAVRGPFS